MNLWRPYFIGIIPLRIPINMAANASSSLGGACMSNDQHPMSHKRTPDTLEFLVCTCSFDCVCFYANTSQPSFCFWTWLDQLRIDFERNMMSASNRTPNQLHTTYKNCNCFSKISYIFSIFLINRLNSPTATFVH